MRQRSVLMIDDDRVILDLVGKFMKGQGWDIHKATTGTEGIAKAKMLKAPPDVVLLDIELPDLSGWDVCRAFKEDAGLRQVPVVMISGRRMSSEDKAKGIEIGADDYLTKPFDLSVMLLKIQAILRVADQLQ